MRRILLILTFLARAGSCEELLRDLEQIGSESSFEKYGSAAFDSAGQLCIARTSTRDWKDRILVRCRGSAGWTVDERLDRGEGIESNARLILDGRDRLSAFWNGRRRGEWAIYWRSRDRTWGPEKKIARGIHPAVTRDSRGRIWVAYEVPQRGRFMIELVVQTGQGWSRPLRVESPASDRRPSLAPASNGEVWLAWDSTRSGNYDIFLTRATLAAGRKIRAAPPVPITAHATIDDSPSLAATAHGLWIAWNGMRGHAGDRYRADRHNGDAFVRLYRDGVLMAPPGTADGALPGQVSFGSVNKTPRDAVDPYFHWKQTQNYPVVFADAADRAWIVWRTDATGAHNFDLWARVHDGRRWSEELHLTSFSPGRDEWPSAAIAADGRLQLTWEGQLLPRPGDESKFLGGDVDAYNTLAMSNAVLTAALTTPETGWKPAELTPAPEERFLEGEMDEPPAAGSKGAVTRDGRFRIFFGDPHSHTILSDAKTGLPDQILSLARDRRELDFAVVSDHMEMGQLSPAEYAELQLNAAVFDEPGRFVSLTGWEWTAGPAYGHRVILYRDEGGRPLSWSSSEGDTIEELYAHLRRDHPGVMSPHHTGQAMWGRWNPDAAHDEELEPNFEIASWHGRFEFYGNPWEGRRQVPGHQYQDALRRGRHVGVMGASDTHHLSPGEGGLTAVLAERLDRASLYDALRNRRNYATTGARIVLEFEAAGATMGSRIKADGPVEMRVRVEGTAAIDRVEIVRNLVDTFAAVRVEQNPSGFDGLFVIYEPRQPQGSRRIALPDTRRLEFSVTDVDLLPGEASYYVRVTQGDGQQAWSSPIWISR